MKKTMVKRIIAALICCTAISSAAFFSINKANAADTNKNLYINGTQVANTEIYTDSGYTFIPADDVAKAFGDTVTETETRLTITHQGKTLVFKLGQSIYTVNNETKNIAVTEVNGVKVPSGTAKVKNMQNKIYVPVEVLKNELGYDIKSDGGNVWVGNKPDTSTSNTVSNSSINANNSNMHLSMDNGWVCPQLPDGVRSTDDLLADSEALQKYLEFKQNGQTPTSASYDPINGLAPYVITSTGPYNGLQFSSVLFEGYYANGGDGYIRKVNQINPQVLKFYFPNSWEWIHNKIMSGETLNGLRTNLDGRDTLFIVSGNSLTIDFSKVGGTLNE